jgi:hypothetical protein
MRIDSLAHRERERFGQLGRTDTVEGKAAVTVVSQAGGRSIVAASVASQRIQASGTTSSASTSEPNRR